MRAIIVPPGGSATHMGDGVYALVTEDGECLFTHICSHACYAEDDLFKRRPERQQVLDEKGITEFVWLADSGLTLDELQRRNALFALEHEAVSDA